MMGKKLKEQQIKRWVDISKKRIINILNRYKVCYIRQFETKISEAGPPNIRPEPIFIKHAKDELLNQGTLIRIENSNNSPIFFSFNNFYYNDEAQIRHRKLKKLHKKYVKIAQNPNNCGKVLEKVVYDSARECKTFSIVGSPTHPPQNINGHDFNKIGHPEFVLIYNSPSTSSSRPTKAIIECKNIRHWLYPDAHEIWEFLYKAFQCEMVPILFTRKIAYPTRFLFMSIGAMGFEMHNQYFAPNLKEKMDAIIHKNELGFHNISFSETKEERIIRFLDNTVESRLPALYNTLLSKKNDVLRYAVDLSKKLCPAERKQIYRDAFLHLVRPEWIKETQEYYPVDF